MNILKDQQAIDSFRGSMKDFPALELLHNTFFNVLADIQCQKKDIEETGITMQRDLVII